MEPTTLAFIIGFILGVVSTILFGRARPLLKQIRENVKEKREEAAGPPHERAGGQPPQAYTAPRERVRRHEPLAEELEREARDRRAFDRVDRCRADMRQPAGDERLFRQKPNEMRDLTAAEGAL